MGPDTPVLIMGDINVEPGSSPVLQLAISNGLIFDLGVNTGPTFIPSRGKARRLDVVMATKSAASALLHITSLQNSGLPGHFPVAAQFNFPVFSEIIVPRIRKPAALPEFIQQDEALAQELLHQFPSPSNDSVDDIYKHFPQLLKSICLRPPKFPAVAF